MQPVNEATLPLADGESVDAFDQALRDQLRPILDPAVARGWWWVRALFGDFVIVRMNQETEAGSAQWTEQISFTRGDDGAFVFGERQRVKVDIKVSFLPAESVESRTSAAERAQTAYERFSARP